MLGDQSNNVRIQPAEKVSCHHHKPSSNTDLVRPAQWRGLFVCQAILSSKILLGILQSIEGICNEKWVYMRL